MLHAHSGLRWLVLILLLVAIFNAFSKKNNSNFTAGDKKIYMFSMVLFHIQFLLGFVMYFTSGKVQFFKGWMKEDVFRFFGMEHLLIMTIAFVLLTMGYSKSKKASGAKKHKVIATFYTIALILVLAGIPWPFREALGGQWF